MKDTCQHMKAVPCDRNSLGVIKDWKEDFNSTPMNGFTKFAVKTRESINLDTNQAVGLQESTNKRITCVPFIDELLQGGHLWHLLSQQERNDHGSLIFDGMQKAFLPTCRKLTK